MSEKEAMKKEALEALESILPGISQFLESEEYEQGRGEDIPGLDVVVALFQETKKIQKEYPILFSLAMDALNAIKDHEVKLELLKNMILSLDGMISGPMTPPDDGYLN